jgi:hypothetical protein
MNLLFKLCTIGLTVLPSLAFAFSLLPIKSIKCSDATQTDAIKMFLTTDDSAADLYLHTATTIGFDYGNLDSAYTQSGKFTLQNDPDAENGVISLVDLYAVDTDSASSLVLQPTSRAGKFVGILDGDVETGDGWQRLNSRQMDCKIEDNSDQ